MAPSVTQDILPTWAELPLPGSGSSDVFPPACSLSQVGEANCRAFTRRAAQGDTELLANLPDQRVALRHVALACLVGTSGGDRTATPWSQASCFNTDLLSPQGGPHLQLSASDLGLLGILVCDMDPSSIVTADPHVLQNLLRCPRLTASQQGALNTLLASGRTQLGWVRHWVRLGPSLLEMRWVAAWVWVHEITGIHSPADL